MKKFVSRAMGFAVTTALLFIGCEDGASPKKEGLVDNFLVRVNEKPASGGGSGVYKLTILSDGSGATKGGNYPAGMTIEIDAGRLDVCGKFEQWTTKSNGVTFVNNRDAKTSFDMPANDVTVEAVYKPQCTVTVLSAGIGATGSGGPYYSGATISITAGNAPTGYQFKNWVANTSVTFANANHATTTFTMPVQKTVVVVAVFNSTFTDTRSGGKTYNVVKIGDQTWMAENLNYSMSSASWCYGGGNPAENCVKYGRLYDWSAANTACPSGWHLPDTAEWSKLVEMGGVAMNSKKFKASGWDGTDDFGFSALPGGLRTTSGNFYTAGNQGFWWTATGSGSDSAYYRYISNNIPIVDWGNSNVGEGLSVRCVADD